MAEEEEQAGPSTSPRSDKKLFLGGLSWETDEEKIRSCFEHFGEIVEVIVMRDAGTKKPRGFGFITFKDPAVAEAVCRETHILDGRQIDAKHSVPQEQKPKSKKIFVGGLAPDTQEGQFKAYFQQYGNITDAQIMQDHLSGRSRGFGFVTFEEDSAVEKVFTAGKMHELAGKLVEVKTATPRGSGPVSGRGASQTGRGLGRAMLPGRTPAGFEADVDPSQAGYAMSYGGVPGYASMMQGYQMLQPPYPYGNMFVGPYGYGYPQPFHPGYQIPPGAAFAPGQQAFQFQMGQPGSRGYAALGSRPLQSPQSQQAQAQVQAQGQGQAQGQAQSQGPQSLQQRPPR